MHSENMWRQPQVSHPGAQESKVSQGQLLRNRPLGTDHPVRHFFKFHADTAHSCYAVCLLCVRMTPDAQHEVKKSNRSPTNSLHHLNTTKECGKNGHLR